MMAITQNELRFDIDVSIRYHNRRRAFFNNWHKVTTFIGILGGSVGAVAFATAVGKWWNYGLELGLGFALLVAIVNALDLTIGFSERARMHDALYKKFVVHDAKIEAAGETSEEQIRQLQSERLLIEHDEPPIFNVLYAQCQNEAVRVWRSPTPKLIISFRQRVLAQWVRMRPEDIQRESA